MPQTDCDWELILVDDGSPDNSGEICDDYAQKDKRIKVIHKQNGGVSDARQAGLDAAKGEFIIHADPDDWVEPKMLEELLHKVKDENADMVICDMIWEKGTCTELHIERPTSLDNEIILCDLFEGKIHGSCCNKLVRRDLFRQYDISFPKGIQLREDLYVVASLLVHPIIVSYLNKAFYHYAKQETQALLLFQTQHDRGGSSPDLPVKVPDRVLLSRCKTVCGTRTLSGKAYPSAGLFIQRFILRAQRRKGYDEGEWIAVLYGII